MFLPPLDLTDPPEDSKPLEVWLNEKHPQDPRPQLDLAHMIPTRIIRDIIMVYEFGDDPKQGNLPDNLICQLGGSFWTTWDYVISLRKMVSEIKLETQTK